MNTLQCNSLPGIQVSILHMSSAGSLVTIGLGDGNVMDRRPGLIPRTIGYSSDGLLFHGGPAASQRYEGR